MHVYLCINLVIVVYGLVCASTSHRPVVVLARRLLCLARIYIPSPASFTDVNQVIPSVSWSTPVSSSSHIAAGFLVEDSQD